jgi:hypothetical protein
MAIPSIAAGCIAQGKAPPPSLPLILFPFHTFFQEQNRPYDSKKNVWVPGQPLHLITFGHFFI